MLIVSYNNNGNYEIPYDIAVANNIDTTNMHSITATESTYKECHNYSTNEWKVVDANTIYTHDDGFDYCQFRNYDNLYGNLTNVDLSNAIYLIDIQNGAFENNKISNLNLNNLSNLKTFSESSFIIIN